VWYEVVEHLKKHYLQAISEEANLVTADSDQVGSQEEAQKIILQLCGAFSPQRSDLIKPHPKQGASQVSVVDIKMGTFTGVLNTPALSWTACSQGCQPALMKLL
jgi:hypothetical protein